MLHQLAHVHLLAQRCVAISHHTHAVLGHRARQVNGERHAQFVERVILALKWRVIVELAHKHVDVMHGQHVLHISCHVAQVLIRPVCDGRRGTALVVKNDASYRIEKTRCTLNSFFSMCVLCTFKRC